MHKVGQKNNQDRVFLEKQTNLYIGLDSQCLGNYLRIEDETFEQKEIFGRNVLTNLKHKV